MYVSKIVDINTIDTTGIYFNYDYSGSSFDGFFPLDISEENFTATDNLKIEINSENPSEYKFIQVVYGAVQKEENIILELNSDTDDLPFNYRTVQQKPLFEGAKNEFENDSLIMNYFLRELALTGPFKKIGVFIIIDENGKASFKSSPLDDQEQLTRIANLISLMPKFKPAFHNGKPVKVSFLIEVPE